MITGLIVPPLMEVQAVRGQKQILSRSYSVKIVPATFSSIASVTKPMLKSYPKIPKVTEEKIQSFARASHLAYLKDQPRKGEKLTLSPSGTLAAITDSLGVFYYWTLKRVYSCDYGRCSGTLQHPSCVQMS